MKSPAKLVSIEDINFAGKTTKTNLLKRTLTKKGHGVCTFKFPDYSTQVGRLLHRLLNDNKTIPLQTTFALFSVNRLELKYKIARARIRLLIQLTVKHFIKPCGDLSIKSCEKSEPITLNRALNSKRGY